MSGSQHPNSVFREIWRRLTVPMDRVDCPMCGADLDLDAYPEHDCFVAWLAEFTAKRQESQHTERQLAGEILEVVREYNAAAGQPDKRFPGLLLQVKLGYVALAMKTTEGPILVYLGPPGFEVGHWSMSPLMGAHVAARIVAPQSVRIQRLWLGPERVKREQQEETAEEEVGR